MAGFHLPRDPYFPSQGNAGWIEEEPENIIEEDPEEDPEEENEEYDDDDDEGIEEDFEEYPKVYDPLSAHAPRRDFQGPTPNTYRGGHLLGFIHVIYSDSYMSINSSEKETIFIIPMLSFDSFWVVKDEKLTECIQECHRLYVCKAFLEGVFF